MWVVAPLVAMGEDDVSVNVAQLRRPPISLVKDHRCNLRTLRSGRSLAVAAREVEGSSAHRNDFSIVHSILLLVSAVWNLDAHSWNSIAPVTRPLSLLPVG